MMTEVLPRSLQSTPSPLRGGIKGGGRLARCHQKRRAALGLDQRGSRGALAEAVVLGGNGPRVKPEGNAAGGINLIHAAKVNAPPIKGELPFNGEAATCHEPTP